MNVIGTRPDGWWRDRDGAVRRLVSQLAALGSDPRQEVVTVVFDGRPVAGVGEGTHDGVEVRYARRAGRDAADDRIVEELDTIGAGGPPVVVVTADRGLRERARRAGAEVASPSALLTRLEGPRGPGGGDSVSR